MEDVLAETIARAMQNGTLGLGVIFAVERIKPMIKYLFSGFDKAVVDFVLVLATIAIGLLGNSAAYGFEQHIMLEGAIVGFLASGGYYLVKNGAKSMQN